MVDWNTGAPNARYRVLELLKNNFGPGNKIVDTKSESPYIYALGYVTGDGKHKLLLVNKRDRDFELTLPQTAREIQFVDQTTANQPPGKQELNTANVTLRGLGVAIVTL